MERVEGGSCSFNANGGDQIAVLDMVPYSVDESTEIEPLDVNPVALIDEEEFPELISSD